MSGEKMGTRPQILHTIRAIDGARRAIWLSMLREGEYTEHDCWTRWSPYCHRARRLSARPFKGVEEVGSGMLKLRFTDSTTALASAVIGCDGIKSKVRGFVYSPGIQPQYANECAIRAMVPGPEAIKTLGNDLALNSQLYCGYGGYVVMYPVEHGKFINMVAMPHDGSSTSTWSQNDWRVPTSANEI
jgi:2-polyprenyl-6-methoxyphenol hydroxylase-like FAD-dependent oxidoreductase